MFTVDYNALATAYSQNRRLHPMVLQNLSDGLTPASRVLEIGCGTGNYSVALEATMGCTCFGLDLSAGMLAQARAKSNTLRLLHSPAEILGLRDQQFDLLFSVDVIHHVQQRGDYFQAAYRVLKPGGRLCTVTDSEAIIRRRRPLSSHFPETIEPEIRRYPRITELQSLMTQAGFSRIASQTVSLTYALTDLQPFQRKAFSALHLISDDAWQRGLERMQHDLRQGPISALSEYVLLWGTKSG